MQKIKKNKIISFRVSDQSFAELKRRNIDVSRYCREAIEALLNTKPKEEIKKND